MQLYHGSPILTNKVTATEMEGVEHHLMEFLDVGAECSVGTWKELAMSKVSPVHSAGSTIIDDTLSKMTGRGAALQ